MAQRARICGRSASATGKEGRWRADVVDGVGACFGRSAGARTKEGRGGCSSRGGVGGFRAKSFVDFLFSGRWRKRIPIVNSPFAQESLTSKAPFAALERLDFFSGATAGKIPSFQLDASQTNPSSFPLHCDGGFCELCSQPCCGSRPCSADGNGSLQGRSRVRD